MQCEHLNKQTNKLISLYIPSNTLRIIISRPESGRNYLVTLEALVFLLSLNMQREPEICGVCLSTNSLFGGKRKE